MLVTAADQFRLSTDRKTTVYATPKPSGGPMGATPDGNSFGLPVGRKGSCKDATEWCEAVCYADLPYPSVQNLLDHNWQVYKRNSRSVPRLAHLLIEVVEESKRLADKRGVKHVFRWFWAGDIPSRTFAKAMSVVHGVFPDTDFWAYTRNFDAVGHLPDVYGNLAVYLSVDPFNVGKALKCWDVFGEREGYNLNLAFCADTWEETEQLAAQFSDVRKGPRCPELVGKMPLISWDENGKGQGACVTCNMCVTGVNNVRFASC